MTVAKVEKVKIRVLVLNESESGKSATVPVILAKGAPVVGTDFFSGIMIYIKKNQAQQVDLVSASFSNDEGSAGQTGKVQLEINLEGGNEFVEPYVTTVPDATAPTHLDCVLVNTDEVPESLILEFLEPQENQSIAYPALYFHTSEGVIDPGVSVHRSPPP